MQYSRLGDTGLIVSRLAFGAMTFGTGKGPFAAVSKVGADLADQIIGKTLDAGINFFNTADGYTGGQSEEMLGKALGARRKDVVVSTKCGFRSGEALLHQGLSRQHILASAEGSLKRLGTDYIDVYLVHRVDPHTPVEETAGALDDLVRQGKVRYAGFSNWPAWMADKAVGIQKQHNYARFRAAEMYYSLVGRDVEYDIVPFLEDAGIGMMVWSPLAGGFLTGKYTRENPQGDGGRLTGFDMLPYDREKGHIVVDKVREIAKAHNASPAQIALAWLLRKRGVTSVLIGANKMAQLEDNLGAVNVQLATEQMSQLDELTAPAPLYPHWFTARVQDPPVTAALQSASAAAK
ncbi:MAG: aldo/keto reductase [Acidobacteriia bacterium]|nr:aldo/keto reductase [Terriglobia bacterium]